MIQRRYLCGKCDREWVDAYQWTIADGCVMPGCGSTDVAAIEFEPLFPGADLRTTASDLPAGALSPRESKLVAF